MICAPSDRSPPAAPFLGKKSESAASTCCTGWHWCPAIQELPAHGLAPDIAAERSLNRRAIRQVPADIQLSLPDVSAADACDVFRILDAAANRAREGLRVVEDYVRFTLDDRHLTGLLKDWRHRLAEVLSAVDAHQLVSSRDTRSDVGTNVRTRREGLRQSIQDVGSPTSNESGASRTLEGWQSSPPNWAGN